jgi:CRP/FNR family transcriptional regulator, transcriptional activator FtrB
MNRLHRVISIEQVPARTVLIEEGKAQHRLFILIDGLLQLFTHRGGEEVTLAIMKAPTFAFAETIVRDADPLASARTLQASCVGHIAVEQARRLFEQEPDFARMVTNGLAENWRSMLQERKNARTRSGIQRLIAWILAMQRHAEAPCEITLPYDKGILAARLDVAPATLSRDFARLAPLGVNVRHRTLEISDTSRLQELTTIDALNTPPVP